MAEVKDATTTGPAPPPPPVVVVGIDLGALATKVTLGPSHDHELVRNAHGGHATPTAVTFPLRRARLLGEDAAEASRADGNTVGALERLLPGATDGGGDAEDDVLAPFRRYEVRAPPPGGAAAEPQVSVPNAGGGAYSGTALVAMLLGNVRRNAAATLARLAAGGRADGDGAAAAAADRLHFAFAVPPSYPPAARAALADAAHAAGATRASVVDATRCVAAVCARKFGEAAEKKTLVVVEMGHARSCVVVLRVGNAAAAAEDAPHDDEEPHAPAGAEGSDTRPHGDTAAGEEGRVAVLSAVSSPTLGAANIDVALLRHFLATDPALSHHTPESLPDNSRQTQRLLGGCRKLKHLLSMLPENKVTVESVGKNDSDVTLSCTRELLKQLCEESVSARLRGMIASALKRAGESDAAASVDAVEVTGGGTRVPFVQEVIRAAAGKEEGFALSRSLDDSSLAFGASLVGAASASSSGSNEDAAEIMEPARVARREELLKVETALSARDVELRRKDELRNRIEAHVLELRSARHSAHGALLPTSDEFKALLDETDEWLFSEECDECTTQQMEDKWSATRSKTEEMCGDYLAAKRAEAQRKEAELEQAARQAAAEAAANGDDADDHDTRRLTFPRRMEIVLKNKKEANELVAGGNYRHAAARYAKALTHCAKFFDLSPAEEEEVRHVKLSLHLNAALAYIKVEKLDPALRSCNDALELDAHSVKALYRRATVLYQKRKFDNATGDLKEAARLAPEDKAVKKLRQLVDQQVEKQKRKEKAMAKKMFG